MIILLYYYIMAKRNSSYFNKISPHVVVGSVANNICRPEDKDWYCVLSRFFSAIMMILVLIFVLFFILNYIRNIFR